MKKKIVKVLSSYWAFLFIFSCLTINVYFPAAAVQDAADKFVEDVQSANKNAGEGIKSEGAEKDNSQSLGKIWRRVGWWHSARWR